MKIIEILFQQNLPVGNQVKYLVIKESYYV